MSTLIHAGRGAVWRAVTAPSELIRWDDRLLELLEPIDEEPRCGQQARWRFLLGNVPVIYSDRLTEVRPYTRLRSSVSLGLFQFAATHTFTAEGAGAESTRVSLNLVAANAIPVVGGCLDRFAVRRTCVDFVDTRLRLLREWCERDGRETGTPSASAARQS